MSKHEKHLSPHNSQGNIATSRMDASANGRDHAVSIDEQIRLRAYELYLDRGGRPDDDLADWLQAEQELRGKQTAEGARD